MDISHGKTQHEMEIQALREENCRLKKMLQASPSEKDQEINRLNRCNAELTEFLAEQTLTLKSRLEEMAQMCQQLSGQLELGQSSPRSTVIATQLQQVPGTFDKATVESQNKQLKDQVTILNTQLQEFIEQNSRWQSYNTQCEENLQTLKHELETMKKGAKTKQAELRQIIHKLEQELEAARKEIRKVLRGADNLHAENDRLCLWIEAVKEKQVLHVVEGFPLSDSILLKVKRSVETGLKRGLGLRDSDEKCPAHISILPTHVRLPAEGRVNTEILVLDINESQLIIKLVRNQVLHSQTVDLETRMDQDDQDQQQGSVLTGQQLFDKIAAEVETFLDGRGLLGGGQSYATSIIFRFPVRLDSLAAGGQLLSGTKEFQCRDAEGEDVCKLFTEAISRRQNIADSIHLEAVVNDTVNCMTVVAQTDRNCYLGVILDSGMNVCCRVPRECVKKRELYDSGDDHLGVICNTELGAFGKNGCLDFIRTSIDKKLDDESRKPGEQILEKMTSAKYLPELMRLILKVLASLDVVFGGEFPQSLSVPYSFKIKYISEIESDIVDNTEDNTRNILEELGLQAETITTEDCARVKKICQFLVERAASLTAAGVAGVMEVVGKPNITVAVDGDLYRLHRLYRETFHKQLYKFVESKCRHKVTLVQGAESSTGAAIVANDQLLQPPARSLDQCRSGSNSSFNSDN